MTRMLFVMTMAPVVVCALVSTIALAGPCDYTVTGEPCGGLSTTCEDHCEASVAGCNQHNRLESLDTNWNCHDFPNGGFLDCDDRVTPKIDCYDLYLCSHLTLTQCAWSPVVKYKCGSDSEPSQATVVQWDIEFGVCL